MVFRKNETILILISLNVIFRNELNKFNNTGTRMFDFIYRITLNYFEIVFLRENSKIVPCIGDVITAVNT